MDYRDEVFMTVAEKLSFSKAADVLFISQPAVTKHIKELENKLKVNLFERKGNKIHLSLAGQLCYDKLKDIKALYNELSFELGKINNTHQGVLRIGASSTIAQYVIPQVLADFHKRYPQIQLELYNGNSDAMINLLHQNEIELALVENSSSESDIRYVPFLEDEIIIVASSKQSISKQKTISSAKLTDIPMVLREKGSGSLEVIMNQLSKQGIATDKLRVVMHLGSTESIKNFLQSFNGISLVSERSVTRELANNELSKINAKDFSLIRQFRLASLQGHETEMVETFKNYLLQYNL